MAGRALQAESSEWQWLVLRFTGRQVRYVSFGAMLSKIAVA
jgi:hypothetical protein